MLTLPFAAGLLDWMENVLLLILLRDPTTLSKLLVFVASAVSLVKWILILVTVLAIIHQLSRRIRELVR